MTKAKNSLVTGLKCKGEVLLREVVLYVHTQLFFIISHASKCCSYKYFPYLLPRGGHYWNFRNHVR